MLFPAVLGALDRHRHLEVIFKSVRLVPKHPSNIAIYSNIGALPYISVKGIKSDARTPLGAPVSTINFDGERTG